MDAMTVAGYIATKTGDVTHEERVRLQKLLYFADGRCLAWTGHRLLDEPFEAWREGPVVRRVYETGITRVRRLPAAQQRIVDTVLAFYSRFSADDLSLRTHHEPPWQEARRGLSPQAKSKNPISIATMRRHFLELSLRDLDVPRRPVERSAGLSAGDVEAASRAVAGRWSEALDELAGR